MSNLPPNPYNTSGPPAMEADASQLNHNPPHNFVPPGQLPPGYGSLKQDANSNSPIPSSMLPPNSAIGQLNNYNQSANSSPAFNHSGMMPLTGQSSPMRPNMKPSMSQSSNQNFMNPSASVSNASPISFTSNYQQRQINDNAPPLIPSSHSQPVLNGPPTLPPVASQPSSEYFTAINSFDTNASKTDGSPNIVPGSFAHQVTSPSSIMSKPISGVLSPQSAPLSRNSPLVGSITGQPNSSATSMGSTQSRPGINGASNMSGPSGFQHAPVGLKGPGGPPGHVGQPFSPPTGSPSSGSSVTLQPAGPPSGPASAASSALMSGSKGSIVSGSPSRPITSGPMMAGPNVQAMSGPPSASSMTSPPMSGSIGPTVSGPSSGPSMASPSSFHSFSGPAVSGPPIGGPPKPSMGAPPSLHSMSTPTGSVVSGPSIGGPPSGPTMAAPPSLHSMSGPPIGPAVSGPPIGPAVSGPPIGPAVSGPPIGPAVSGPPIGPAVSGPPYGGPPKPLMGTPPSLHSVSGPPIGAPPIGPSMVSPPGSYAMSPPLGGPASGPTMASPSYSSMSGPPMGPPVSGPPMGPPVSGPPMGPPVSGPPMGPLVGGPPMGLPVSGPPTGPMAAPNLHSMSGPPMGPPVSGPPSGPSGPMGPPGAYGQKNGLPGSSAGPYGPGLQSPQGYQGGMPPKPTQGPPPYAGPTNPPSNMQGRYPPIPQGNYISQQPQMSQPQFPSYQGLNQQMGQLSVTKQGFDQLWGHHMVDLMTTKNILPEYPEDPPEIRLANQFADAPNCSPEIFRCTVNRIPETNSLLQKSRLPLGILIHPFKDLNHLPVIQCTTIVRCRACRTYINPFVYFVDAKRWKCNLCYRVNDLPEEFQYDPVSKSYGDPSRRPEIKSATIEFIAPGEYMLRPPQPAVYLFLMDVSQIARDSGYLQVLCETLKTQLDQLPGDARTQVGFICFDAHVHCYLMSDGLTRVKEMTVLDIDDVFLPSPESLLVNLGERREMVRELLTALPQRFAAPGPPSSALGAALQLAYKLMAPTGGRVTVFQTCLPNVGPGALQSREDPNARSAAEVAHLSPATDFYKRLALDCSGAQIAVDLFLLNAQYADLATLSGMSKFSAGTVYHLPLFRAQRQWQADLFARMLTRYLTRKIGFEAVMRVRCTRGISIHTFHGNFFVRSTDLLSLPNVSPDAGFGMQLAIEESLADLQQVCFQAALLYTSSKGERRIRVHTLALPTASNLTDVLHSADQQCIIGLLSKMAVDRCVSASMGEAREALSNVCVDLASASRLAQNLPSGAAASIVVPYAARLLPLYLLALLKRKAFRAGTSTRLDDRVSDMCDMKSLPLPQLMRAVYPDLYPIHALRDHTREDSDAPDPPRMHLSAERISSNGAYLLDDGETIIIYVCHNAPVSFLSDTFGVAAFSQLPDEARVLPLLRSEGNDLLQAFIDKLNDDRPYISNLLILRDNSPTRTVFTERLVEDRVESAFAYYELLQHIKAQLK